MKLSKKITALILATILMFTAGITAFAEETGTEPEPKKENVLADGGILATELYQKDTAAEEKKWDAAEKTYTDENGTNWVYLNKKNYIVSEDNSDYLYRLNEDGTIAIAYNYYGTKPYDEIVIPDTLDGYTVSRIDAFAFYMCSRISGIRIPDTVKEIGHYAFGYCSRLERIVIGSGVEKFSADAVTGVKNDIKFSFTSSEAKADEITVWSYKKLYAKTSCDWTKLASNASAEFNVSTEELPDTTRTSPLSLMEIIWQYIKEFFDSTRNYFASLFASN